MPLCKPGFDVDGDSCLFCGKVCEPGGAEKTPCPYETEFMGSDSVYVFGLICMGIAVVGFLVMAVLAWMGKL